VTGKGCSTIGHNFYRFLQFVKHPVHPDVCSKRTNVECDDSGSGGVGVFRKEGRERRGEVGLSFVLVRP